MTRQVPNFENPILNRIAQGDMSVLKENYDFTLTERAGYKNWNVLSVAATKGYLDLVNTLLEIDTVSASAAAMDNMALRWAAINGHLAVVNRLLEIEEVSASAAANDNLALSGAAENGHLEVVNRLLEIAEVRANTAAGDNAALFYAAGNGHLEVVNCLLEIESVRANAAVSNNVALRWAAKNGHLEVVNRLLEINEVSANAAAYHNGALSLAAENGHLKVVNRLLEINEVRANAAAMNNQALRLAAKRGHSEVVYALAKTQWPLGKQDMPEEMQQHLPLIKIGAQLYTAKREQERILISALQNKPVLRTNSLYASSPLGFDRRANRLFSLPGDVVDSIASYAGYKKQFLAEQIRKDDYQNAWNDMRRSEHLHGLFANTKKRSREEDEEHLDCRACKANKVG